MKLVYTVTVNVNRAKGAPKVEREEVAEAVREAIQDAIDGLGPIDVGDDASVHEIEDSDVTEGGA